MTARGTIEFVRGETPMYKPFSDTVFKHPPIHLAADGIAVDLFNQLDEDEIHLKEVLVPLVTLT